MSLSPPLPNQVIDTKPAAPLKPVKPARLTRADKARRRAEEVILGTRKKSILQFELTTKKVKPEELMNFARQGASFIRAGIPVLDALEVLTTDMANPMFRAILIDVARKLRSGRSFAEACQM